MLRLQLAGSLLVGFVLFALILFVPAWTVRWWQAWILIAVTIGAAAWMGIWLLAHDRELLRERLRPAIQPDQPWSDKLAISSLLLTTFAWFAFAAIDVSYLRWLPPPPRGAAILGLVLVVVSLGWTFLPLRQNRFLATAVRRQVERGHRLVDSGVYAYVRHPLYTGVVVFLVGSALWLGSTSALVSTPIPLSLLVVRLLLEERFLCRELPGYEAYTQRVRYRLFPWVW